MNAKLRVSWRGRARLALAACGVGLLLLPASGAARPNDIALGGLGRPEALSIHDAAVARYRRLVSELVIAMSPRTFGPGETLGLGGFELALSTTTTSINSDA